MESCILGCVSGSIELGGRVVGGFVKFCLVRKSLCCWFCIRLESRRKFGLICGLGSISLDVCEVFNIVCVFRKYRLLFLTLLKEIYRADVSDYERRLLGNRSS